jgi:hypothetical protein
MSISRPKRATYRKQDAAPSPSRPQREQKLPKWKDVVEGQPDDAFASYSPTAVFTLDGLLSHPKFGKGIVVEVEQGKVSILFEAGIKKLVCAS